MKLLTIWFGRFINIVIGTLIGVLIAFYLIWQAPTWIGDYCLTHDSAHMCHYQLTNDD